MEHWQHRDHGGQVNDLYRRQCRGEKLSAQGRARHSGLEVVDDPRGGFVLALVVLLLFGIGVAGAAGYQVILNEALLSVYAKETQTALSIARAGLSLYIGKQIGVHDDTVTYSIDGGDAVVTARLVAKIDDFETLYLLGSEGVYTDPTFFTGSTARRTVYQYAKKREVALDHVAALTQASGNLHLSNGTNVSGNDEALSADCEQSQTNMIGVMMGSGTFVIEGGAVVSGSQISITVGSVSAVLDSLGLDWDLLTDPDFPVDYDGVLPIGLPADSFPVIRFPANLTVGPAENGRGVLIVAGDLIIQNGWDWDGVVLAGYLDAPDDPFQVRGLVVSGLDGAGRFTDIRKTTSIFYNRCYAFQAGKRLSHFELVGGTWWEEM